VEGRATRQPGSGFPGKAGERVLIASENHVFYAHIRILLIITNPTIYICYIKNGGNAEICVLAVRDNELDVGDSEVASSEVAEDRDMREKARGSHVDSSEE
jgi:hypothetical protein